MESPLEGAKQSHLLVRNQPVRHASVTDAMGTCFRLIEEFACNAVAPNAKLLRRRLLAQTTQLLTHATQYSREVGLRSIYNKEIYIGLLFVIS